MEVKKGMTITEIKEVIKETKRMKRSWESNLNIAEEEVETCGDYVRMYEGLIKDLQKELKRMRNKAQ